MEKTKYWVDWGWWKAYYVPWLICLGENLTRNPENERGRKEINKNAILLCVI